MTELTARFIRQIDAVPAAEWDRMLPDGQPFLRHAFLHALEDCGVLRAELGWVPNHLLLYQGTELVGAAPCYLKYNSHGEFVFDWAWAEAYERHGLQYYPKLLVGVPYTPISGARLLVAPDPGGAQLCSGPSNSLGVRIRATLLRTLREVAQAGGLSSVHLNFLTDQDAAAAAHDPWLPRMDWQFHWRNQAYTDFSSFLDTLSSKKRKNIRQERRKLKDAGIEFRHRSGRQIDSTLWSTLHALYARTFEAKWNTPALTLEFFKRIGATMPDQVLAITAEWGGEVLAMALCLRDDTRLYGRYWGCFEDVAGLHFETCYYQGIEYAIANGLSVFEPGAQGEHKIARGFLPQRVRSAHHIVHPGFRVAIRKALDQEHIRRQQLGEIYQDHSPYRDADQVSDRSVGDEANPHATAEP